MARDLTQGGLYAVIPAQVLYDPHLRPRAKLLYGEIVRLAQATGFCYAGNKSLLQICTYVDPETGAETAITERTLQSLLAELRDRGHIRMDMGPVPCSDGGGCVTRRRIFVGQTLASMPQNDPQEGGEKNFTPENNFAEGVKKISPPIKCKKNTREKNTPRPPTSPSLVPEVAERVREYAGGDRELLEAIVGLLENRARLPKPKPVKTLRAMTAILRELDRLSGGDRAMKLALLDKATLSNWLTVYPLKADELPATAAARVEETEGVRYF